MTMSSLEPLHQLTKLNLSCNKLQNITGLRLMQNLKVLVLAHNRITSLQPLLDLGEYSKLDTLDLTDNYVAELS